MIDFHQDERSFWKELNPARFHMLADAYQAARPDPDSQPAQASAPPGIESLRADGKWGNLLDDLGGG